MNDSHGFLRAAPPPAILHLSTPQTQIRPDITSPVVEVNRSPGTRHRAQTATIHPTIGDNDHVKRGRPQLCPAQNAAPDSQSSSLNYSVQVSNASHRQEHINGRTDYEISVVSPGIANDMQTAQGASAILHPTVQHGGLAEKRQDRPSFRFVGDNEPDPAQRTKREQTSKEKLNRKQLKEKGDACMQCCLERKICDLQDRCWKCEMKGCFCFRNIEQLWLWKATQQDSLQAGSREEAMDIARRMTFDHTSRRLRALPRLGQDLHDNKVFPMIYITSQLGDISATSHIAVTSHHLAVMLQPLADNLRRQIRSALSDHIPDAVLRDLPGNSSDEERSLLASAQSAFRLHTFLANTPRLKYHASLCNMTSAREVGCFFLECCASMLAIETEEVLTGIRTQVRQSKRPGLVTKHAFGLYYTILSDLQQRKTESAFDIIMEPLISRAQEVMDDLGTLYQNIYGSTEHLQTFIKKSIPVVSELDNLHVSHELLSAVDQPIKSWDPSVNDPFRKDFWLFLSDLLVLDGRVTWISEVRFVQIGVLGLQNVTATDRVSLEGGRSGASESGASQFLYSSQDITLLNPAWDDHSTCVQSPSDVGHAVGVSDGNQPELRDVKGPLDLVGIHTGNTVKDQKRELSPVLSDSSRRSPTPKRSELDTWQQCLENTDNHFNEAYSEIMASRRTPC